MRAIAERTISDLFERARTQGRDLLLDPEGLVLLESLGFTVPHYIFVAGADDLAPADLAPLTTTQLVLKVVTPQLIHKTAVGGVVMVQNDHDAVSAALRRLEARFAHQAVAGYTVSEFVRHDGALGSQLLLGMRWTEAFGTVVTLGPGGVDAELLAEKLAATEDVAVIAPELTPADRIPDVLTRSTIVRLATGHLRGFGQHVDMSDLVDIVQRTAAFAARHVPRDVSEFEINPLVATEQGLVALDVTVRLGAPVTPPRPARPLQKLRCLLEPRTIAIMGVSEKMNVGRIVLRNVLREGFAREGITIVKSGVDDIDGVRCYPDLASLPTSVDLLVVSVAASKVPAVIRDVVSRRRAESVIVIPGGLGEREGTADLERDIVRTLDGARRVDGQGPVVNGGNCLGVRSKPGRYDTLFIPDYKLPTGQGRESPLAIISQSGAFAAARASKLANLNPRYVISVGNQTDLTVGDYLTYLKDDPAVTVFACYVEGFRPLDGQQWLRAASEIAAGGRTVILYRAGRTRAGASATALHTASVAGDYTVTRALARNAGVLMAECLEDFEDFTQLSCLLDGTPIRGWRLGAVTNAGFESVAVADNLGRFRLADFTPHTATQLGAVLEQHRLTGVVGVQNPLDLTPVMDDEGFARAVRAVLADDHVDVGIVGCVPMTSALKTLAPSQQHDENVAEAASIVQRLIGLRGAVTKPWVAVVDGGAPYDAMAQSLTEHGIPTFRSMDRALRALETCCARHPHAPPSTASGNTSAGTLRRE